MARKSEVLVKERKTKMEKHNKSEISDSIIQILDKQFSNLGVEKKLLKYVDLFDDLGMDSTSFISLIVEIESEFGIQIPDDWLLMERFRNFSLIYSMVEAILNNSILHEEESNDVQ